MIYLSIIKNDRRNPLTQIYQTGVHVGSSYGFAFQMNLQGEQLFYGYNTTTGYEELYYTDIDEQENLFKTEKYQALKPEIVKAAAEILQSDPRWSGYWSSYRLHNAAFLPINDTDMQMLKPA